MKLLTTCIDAVIFIRPVLLYPAWIFMLAGIWGARHASEFSPGSLSFFRQMLVWSAATAIMGAVYILNQIKDIETDRINHKMFLLAQNVVGMRFAIIETILLSLFGIGAAFYSSLEIGTLLSILLIIAGWLYNFDPFQWKNRPVLGIVANGLGGILLYSVGWKMAGGAGWLPMRSLIAFFATCGVTLNTTLPDLEGDRKTGKQTFAVRYGLSATAWAALVLEGITVLLAWFFREWLLFYPGILVLPFFIHGVIRPNVANVIRGTKISVLALAVAVCVFFPYFLLPVFLVFFGTKWYYKAKFDMNYPNFKSK